MKITEITEGWGEYSNKSNHRMNKFKRKGDLNEFTEFNSKNWSPEMASAIEDILRRNDGEALVSIKDALSELMKVDADEVKKNMKFLINLLKSYDLEYDLEENWGEFKSAVQRGAQAVGNSAVGRGTKAVAGAAGRQIKDMGTSALAKIGNGKAQGSKEMQRVVGGVIKNFNRYLGQTKSKPTVGALKQYLTALGIKNPVMEAVPSMAQLNKVKGMQALGGGSKKQAPAQEPATGGRKDTDVLTRNDLFDIIGKNIQQAMKTGTLPKELKKFLGQ